MRARSLLVALPFSLVSLAACGSSMSTIDKSQTHVDFPVATDTIVNQSGYFWTAGDHAEGSRATDLPYVRSANVHVAVALNVLGGDTVDFRLLINGVDAGTFKIPQTVTTFDATLTFPAVSGPNYVIRYEVTRTVGAGLGSIQIDYTKSTVDLIL